MALTRRDLLDAYRRMSALRLARTGGLRDEACLTGLGWHLRDGDRLCATPMDDALALASGAPLDALADRLTQSRKSSNHAEQTHASALGTALARRLKDRTAITVSVLTDHAARQGRSFDMMRAAQAWSLPLLIVIPHHALHDMSGTPDGRQPEATSPFADRARSFGLDVTAMHAEDFFSVHHTARDVLHAARHGRGPFVLEAAYTGRDPLRLFQDKVIEAGLADTETFRMIERDTARLADRPAPRAFSVEGVR